jgi:hypothetical protein
VKSMTVDTGDVIDERMNWSMVQRRSFWEGEDRGLVVIIRRNFRYHFSLSARRQMETLVPEHQNKLELT